MISFHSADVPFRLREVRKVSSWLHSALAAERSPIHAINVVFTSDEFLLHMNQKFLNHDTYTDIITFPVEDGDLKGGELYISIARVRENAKTFRVNVTDELHRVLIHGVLHLCGYKDGTNSEKAEIRAKEDKYLSLRAF